MEKVRIVRVPTADDLRPTLQQQEDFRRLREWEKDSAANGAFVLGVPANEQNGQRFKLERA